MAEGSHTDGAQTRMRQLGGALSGEISDLVSQLLRTTQPKRTTDFWSMWETTCPRLTHAELGKSINEDTMRSSMHEASLSTGPIRRGQVSDMLFPTW